MSKLHRFAAFGSAEVSVSPAVLRYLATRVDTRTPRRGFEAIVVRGDRGGRQRLMSASMVMALTNKKGA